MRAELRQENSESIRLNWGARAPHHGPSRAIPHGERGEAIADAIRQARHAVHVRHADDLWDDEAMLSRQVDLSMPSGETGLFVIILARGERPDHGSRTSTFAQDSFLRALADTGRTDFGPSDFAPHHALCGYLAVPVSGQQLVVVQDVAREMVAEIGCDTSGRPVSLEGVYAVGPGLTPVRMVAQQQAKESVPIWRRIPRSPSAVG